MFLHDPAVKPFFNRSNQVSGDQQRALAATIVNYADNIDNLKTLGGKINLITCKHASLQIKQEDYSIVGKYLLASIKEVLGDSINDEGIAAWGEAYNHLANIMIDCEKQIYKENSLKDGGWTGFKTFKIMKKKESSKITSFYFKPKDGGKVPTYKAEQYLAIRYLILMAALLCEIIACLINQVRSIFVLV